MIKVNQSTFDISQKYLQVITHAISAIFGLFFNVCLQNYTICSWSLCSLILQARKEREEIFFSKWVAIFQRALHCEELRWIFDLFAVHLSIWGKTGESSNSRNAASAERSFPGKNESQRANFMSRWRPLFICTYANLLHMESMLSWMTEKCAKHDFSNVICHFLAPFPLSVFSTSTLH